MRGHFESWTRIQPPLKSFGSVTLRCSARRSLTFLEFSKPQFPASCWLRSAAEKIATWANLHLETVRKKNTFTPSGYFLSPRIVSARSEEHTSELQSRLH